MIRTNIFFVIFCMLSILGISQETTFPVTIKVIDLDSSNEVSGALVFIDELHFNDTETDEYGIAYFEKVPEGKVFLNIRKQGFLPVRQNIIVSDKVKNNGILVKMQKVGDISEKRLDKKKSIDIENSPGVVIIGGDNSGIIQGDNSYLDNRKTIVNPMVETPKPRLELLEVINNNEVEDGENSAKRFVNRIKFRLVAPFSINTLDLAVRHNSITGIKPKANFITTHDTHRFKESRKFAFIKLINPRAGNYEMIIYSKDPVDNILEFFEGHWNNNFFRFKK